MNISLSTLLAGVAPGQIHAHSATREEFQELKAEGLVGENSSGLNVMSVNTMDRFRITQWSEEINSLWWGLSGEGELGRQAAGYLEQMTAERRQIASSYMDDFFSLSNTLAENLQDNYPASTDLDELLDNVLAGRKPSENSDGSLVPKADKVEAFWVENRDQIDAMQQTYEDLKACPDNLSGWLDEKQIERPLAMDQLVEKHRYSGLNGKYAGAQGLLDSTSFQLSAGGDGQQLENFGPLGIPMDTMDMPLLERYDLEAANAMMQHSIDLALRLGDAGMMKHAVASELMHSERRAILADYQTSFQSMSTAFYDQLGELEPRFSLQDLLDNVAADNEVAMLEDGSEHPQAEQIQAFVKSVDSQLTTLVDKQQRMDQLPRTRLEWQAIPENNRLAQQVVYQQYGLEPWETGRNSRAIRPEQWMGLDHFEGAGAATQERLLSEAHQRMVRLQDLVLDARRFSGDVSFDLDQLIDNFRSGQPLGLTDAGQLHPNSQAIEEMFRANEEEFVAYIDTLWMLGKQDNLSMVDYRSWMTEDNRAGFAEELLDLIVQSRQALNFDELPNPEDSLLAVNTGSSEPTV
ncbi:hypothetical protein QKW35_09280 [Pontibacterium granulatum]|uniref:hypothetical protein n=1 Tax=Pontibacterium granulatum TaxID=2036029 RepID=UPI00249C080A|nr:hypothetical protein [Pontibacterium granulatum]MDI3324567.1 hypothetical protein [Pontibacterium granulatum]